MVKFFVYDNKSNALTLNEPEILLVKEFKDLWDVDRNKCKEDPTGKKRLKAYRELTYIYLAVDWLAPGNKSTPQERHDMAVASTGITKEELQDPVFKAAFDRYNQLQDSSSLFGPLLAAMNDAVHKLTARYRNLDLSERDEVTGKFLTTSKDIMDDYIKLPKLFDAKREAEEKFKTEQAESTGLRGGRTPGFFDKK